VARRETRWLNGIVPDCCPAFPGSNPASPQPTADCPTPGGLQKWPGLQFTRTDYLSLLLTPLTVEFAGQ
jgi:hypothetical protein